MVKDKNSVEYRKRSVGWYLETVAGSVLGMEHVRAAYLGHGRHRGELETPRVHRCR